MMVHSGVNRLMKRCLYVLNRYMLGIRTTIELHELTQVLNVILRTLMCLLEYREWVFIQYMADLICTLQ